MNIQDRIGMVLYVIQCRIYAAAAVNLIVRSFVSCMCHIYMQDLRSLDGFDSEEPIIIALRFNKVDVLDARIVFMIVGCS